MYIIISSREKGLIARKGERRDMENMTDKQLEVIMNLVADKFEGCKDM